MDELLQLPTTAEIIRELADGTWFCLFFSFTCILVWYSWRWLSRGRWPIERSTQAALALSICFLGSSIRSAFLWLQWISINKNLPFDFWKATQPEIITSLFICMIGGMLAINVFIPPRQKTYFPLAIMAACFAIPVIVHYLL